VGLSYAWDLDGDGQFDDSTIANPTWTYAGGLHTAYLKVTDANGATAVSAPIAISAGTRPTATIAAPTAATTWAANQTLSFSGSGADAEDGAIPASRMKWSLQVHHCSTGCHIHPVQDFDGVASGSFGAPDHEYPSYLTLSLTVTDSGGLTDTATVRLDPRTVQLTVDSDPAGLQVGLNDIAGPGPLTKTVIEGSANTVTAPSPQGGLTLVGWSDGATGATRTILARATTRLVARFAGAGGGTSPAGLLPPKVAPPTVTPTIARLVRLKRAVLVRKGGTLRWRVHCRAAVSCPATLVLRTRGSKPRTLARRSLRLKAHSARAVTLKLTRSARALLRKRTSLRAAMVFQARPAVGPHRRTTTYLRLRAPRS
jgi:PKD repeat protein